MAELLTGGTDGKRDDADEARRHPASSAAPPVNPGGSAARNCLRVTDIVAT